MEEKLEIDAIVRVSGIFEAFRHARDVRFPLVTPISVKSIPTARLGGGRRENHGGCGGVEARIHASEELPTRKDFCGIFRESVMKRRNLSSSS